MISGISNSSSLMSAMMAKLGQSQKGGQGEALFSKIDTDSSGGLSLDELTSVAPDNTKVSAAAEKMMSAMDTDGSGEITKEELNSGATALKTAMNNYLLSLQEGLAAA